MTPLAAFILGLLIGWLVEWVIDWIYWRRRVHRLQDATARFQKRLASLEGELESSRKETLTYQGKVSQLEAELASAVKNEQSFVEKSLPIKEEQAFLETEARALREKVSLLEVELADSKNERLSCQEKVSQLESELLSSRLTIQSLQEKADLVEQETGGFVAASLAPQEPESLKTQVSAPRPPSPDDLQVINGIGPAISRRLNQVGIFTFEQLAELTQESLRGILGDVIERLADEESLLEQARQLAQDKQKKGAGGQ